MVIKELKYNLPRGIACLQADDTIYLGNDKLIELE